MSGVRKIIGKMGRLWMLEHTARGALLVVALGVLAALVCLLAGRLFGLPPASLWFVAGGVIVAIAVLAAVARRHRPTETQLAEILDDRTGSGDLFASAMEFDREQGRFGWLGELTVERAKAEAALVQPQTDWSLGDRRHWSAIAIVAGVLVIVYGGMIWLMPTHPVKQTASAAVPPPPPPAVVVKTPQAQVPISEPITPPPTDPAPLTPDTQPAKSAEAVKITNEMIDKYLKEIPQQEVDLTGVTPIRWDEEEVSGKANKQQNRPPDEKIDPIKLDNAMLKDLAQAKKDKVEGEEGKKGGVDVAVMGKEGETKATGNKGGKKGDQDLSNAVSKDPRGDPTRMAHIPPRKGFAIRSVARIPTKLKGEERPMTLLDFLAAVERVRRDNPPGNTDGSVPRAAVVEARVVPTEGVAEDAVNLTQAYFAQLRKADQ